MSKKKQDTGASIGRTSTTRKQKNPNPPIGRPVRFKKRTTYDRKQSRVRKNDE